MSLILRPISAIYVPVDYSQSIHHSSAGLKFDFDLIPFPMVGLFPISACQNIPISVFRFEKRFPNTETPFGGIRNPLF